MHRLIALILMFVIPLQFAGSAAAAVHGHVGDEALYSGYHVHDHDHHDHAQPDENTSIGASNQDHKDDGHHGHYHPVFSSVIEEYDLRSVVDAAGGPILQPPTAFISRTPPLFDRPPLALA